MAHPFAYFAKGWGALALSALVLAVVLAVAVALAVAVVLAVIVALALLVVIPEGICSRTYQTLLDRKRRPARKSCQPPKSVDNPVTHT